MSQQFFLPFIKKEKIAKETWSFYFDRKKNPAYDFKPGQYTRVILPETMTDGKGSNRSFTICSSPLEKKYLLITTKIPDDSLMISDFKKRLMTLSVGENIEFFGPLGGFYLQEENNTPRVFLAGGIGITPFHSMLYYASDRKLSIPLTLFASFSSVEEVCFKNELEEAAHKNPAIKVIYTISNPVNNQSWIGEKGRISESLIRKYIPDITKPIFMTVGPPEMVDDTINMLRAMQIEESHIKAEYYIGY